MVECYSGLYEEGKVKHINGVWPSFLIIQLVYSNYSTKLHLMGGDCQYYKSATRGYTSAFFMTTKRRTLSLERVKEHINACFAVLGFWEGGTIDMLNFTFFV